MLYECTVRFMNVDEHITHDEATYFILADSPEEAEAEALERAEDHPSWHWEDTIECDVEEYDSEGDDL